MPESTLRPSLGVEVGPLKLKNPLLTASGTFGYGAEYASFVDLNQLGALVVKGLSLSPRAGNPPPRIMETTGGMLNAIGLENVGVKAFIAEKLPFLRDFDVPVIANIFGETVEEYQKVAALLDRAPGVSALELNISCPNVKKGGVAFGADPDLAADGDLLRVALVVGPLQKRLLGPLLLGVLDAALVEPPAVLEVQHVDAVLVAPAADGVVTTVVAGAAIGAPMTVAAGAMTESAKAGSAAPVSIASEMAIARSIFMMTILGSVVGET